MSNELKPCPFCGGEAAFGANSCQGFEYVRCVSCKARTWSCYNTKEQAAEAWNTRAERTCKPKWERDSQGYLTLVCDMCHKPIDYTDNFCAKCGAKVVE